MRLLNLTILLLSFHAINAQYSEELVEVLYETDELISIKIMPEIPYINQMLGGVVVNTDDNYYTFTGQGGDTKLYTLDIATGEILFEVDVPQIQMLQFNGSDELVGISKGNPSNIVSLALYNYKTGNLNSFPPIDELEGASISTHNSTIDIERNIFYFVGSKSGTNIWSIIAIDITDGTLIKSIDIMSGETLAGIAFDKEKNTLIGLTGISLGAKSLVEIDPVTETISEIKKISEIHQTFEGHRYWAYDDDNNKYFIVGLDSLTESYLYVIDSDSGDILFQNPYDDDAWIMEEHAPLELRYSPNTNQLLGLRKGEPLPPVGNTFIAGQQNALNVYPNPILNGQITVELLADVMIKNIRIQNLYGTVIYEKNEVNRHTFQLEADLLLNGAFYVIVETENDIWYQSIIKI